MLKSSLVAISVFAFLSLGTSAYAKCNNNTGFLLHNDLIDEPRGRSSINPTALAAWVGFHVAANEGKGEGGEDVEVIGYGAELSIICNDEGVSEALDTNIYDFEDFNGDGYPDIGN